jgi:hypothetical protein
MKLWLCEGSPHVIIDLGALGKGVVHATLSSYRGLARMHREAKLSICCTASVCRQQLYICDTHNQEVSEDVCTMQIMGGRGIEGVREES